MSVAARRVGKPITRVVRPSRASRVVAVLSGAMAVALFGLVSGAAADDRGSAAPVAGFPYDVQAPRPATHDLPLSQETLEEAIREAGRRQDELDDARDRRRNSSEARGSRLATRHAFAGLSHAKAKGLFGSKFAALAAERGQTAAAALPGNVRGYLSDFAAVTLVGGRPAVVASAMPLRVHRGSDAVPVDLTLSMRGDRWAPLSALVESSFPQRLSDGLGIDSLGVKLTVHGVEDVAGEAGPGNTVFYPAVARDTDVVAEPTSRGLELFAQLRSSDSPESVTYDATLADGAGLRSTSNGIAVVRDGKPVGLISAPAAVDAEGRPFPVSLTLGGPSSIVVTVEHHGADVAYPLAVDPLIEDFTGWPSGNTNGLSEWSYWNNIEGVRPLKSPPIASSGAIWPGSNECDPAIVGTCPSGSGLYLYQSPRSWSTSTEARFTWEAPGVYHVSRAEMRNMTLNYHGSFNTVRLVTGVSCGPQFNAIQIHSGQQTNLTDTNIAGQTAVGGIGITTEPDCGKWVIFGNTTWSSVTTSQWTHGYMGGALLTLYPGGPSKTELLGAGNDAEPNLVPCDCDHPVQSATGNHYEQQADLEIPGRGLGLALTRTYNSLLAVSATGPGSFGTGWTSSYTDRLAIDAQAGTVTAQLADGNQIPFVAVGDGTYTAQPWVHAKLTHAADGTYSYVAPDQTSMAFDSNGRLASATDRNGNTTSVAYDDQGRLQTITDPAGRSITLAYNTDSTVSSATDSAQRTVNYTYSNGDLVDVEDVRGGHWIYAYDASHQLTSVTNPRAKTTTWHYDSSNRVDSKTDALGTTTWGYVDNGPSETTTTTSPATGDVVREEFVDNRPISTTHGTGAQPTKVAYDDVTENPKSVTDGNNHTTTYTYDSAGNRTSATDALNRKTQWTYNATRDVTSVTDPMNHKTTYAYDANGNLTSVSRPLTETGQTATTTITYDSHGQLLTSTDPRTRQTTYTYNDNGDRTSTTTPGGHQTGWTYDGVGNMLTETSARGNEPGATAADFTTTYTRDAAGNATDIEDPLGHHTIQVFDANGNLTDVTDRDGNHTVTTYDALDRPTQITRPDGAILKTSYDTRGLITSQIDGLDHATTYGYDAKGRLTSVTDPLQRRTAFAYDGADNQISTTDPQGRTTTYGYDAANQLTSISYSSGAPGSVGFAYNADGVRTQMTDASGTSTYTYDSLDRLKTQKNGRNQTVTYGYNLANEVTSIGYPAALTVAAQGSQQQVTEGTVTRTFDSDGNLDSVTDWLNHQSTFGYDAEGHHVSTTRPNGQNAAYAYDANGLSTSLDDVQGHTTYSYTPEGLLSSAAPTGGTSESYTYDGAKRLTAAGTGGYAFDDADNLTQTQVAGDSVAQQFDAANELTSTVVSGATTATFSYDAQGNRTQGVDASNVQRSYGFDQANRLASYTGPTQAGSGTLTEQYVYDGDGLRQSKIASNQISSEVYDLTSELPLVIEDGPTAYITGPGGLPVEQVTSSGTVRYFAHDVRGSTMALMDGTGGVVQTYAYDPWGQLTGSAPTVENPFLYTGQYADSQTGLLYLRARYYDPTTGQFLSRDPIAEDTRQPYSYANDSPTNFADPSGQCIPVCVVIGAVVVAGVVGAGVIAAREGNKRVGANHHKKVAPDDPSDSATSGPTPGGPDGAALRRKGEELLGRKHSGAARKRWQDWYDTLNKQEKRAYRKAGGPTPGKRQ